MRRLLTVLAVLGLCVSPALAKKKKKRKKRDNQAQSERVRPLPQSWKNTLRHFNPNTSDHDPVNAYLAVTFARLAYMDDGMITAWAAGMGCTDVELERKKGKALLLCADDRMVIAAIEGSNFNSRDLDRIFNAGYRNKTLGGRVHKGGFNLSKELRGKVERFINKRAHRKKPVFLTGHSMGALAAVFTGAHLKRHLGRAPKAMYTFGMPRMGSRTFRQKLGIPAHHYVNSGDGAAILYPSKLHPNGSIWLLGQRGNAIKRTKVANVMTKKWLAEWDKGVKVVFRKGRVAHAMPAYTQHLYRLLSRAQRARLPEPKTL